MKLQITGGCILYSVYWCLKLLDVILINHDSGTSWWYISWHNVMTSSVWMQLASTSVFMNCINIIYLTTSDADDYFTCIWLRHMQMITAYADDYDICRWLWHMQMITWHADDNSICIWLRQMQMIKRHADDHDICRWLRHMQMILAYADDYRIITQTITTLADE